MIFHGYPVGEFYADIIVEDLVILELKAIVRLLPEHQAQLINYLKATGISVGLLVNFGTRRADVKRLYWDEEEGKAQEETYPNYPAHPVK